MNGNEEYGPGSLATFLNEYRADQKLPDDWYLNMENKPPNYQEYIQSREWAGKRREKLHRANYKCEQCGRDDGRLDVHHRTYDRLGNERMSDLEVLCRYCHKVKHGEITFDHSGGNPNEPF